MEELNHAGQLMGVRLEEFEEFEEVSGTRQGKNGPSLLSRKPLPLDLDLDLFDSEHVTAYSKRMKRKL